MSVLIREALDTDKNIFVDFSLELTKFNRNNHGEYCKYDNFEKVLNAVKKKAEETFEERNNDVHIIIASVGEKPVGYALGRIFTQEDIADNGTGRMGLFNELYLADSARGLGIGRKLMDEMIAWFKYSGISRVKLHAYAWNKGARRLYERSGFSEYALSYEKFI